MRRVGALLLLAGLALLVVPAASQAQTAGGGDELGSFSFLGRATGWDLIADDANRAPGHPALQGTVPETSASLSAGPIARGFSAIAWPGPIAGNLGSIVAGTGGPPNATALNDPVRAEANAPGGQPDAKYEQGSVSMVAHADVKVVTAGANMADTGAPGVVGAGSIVTSTKSALDGTKGTSEATSTLKDVKLGPDGVIEIDSIVSTAKGSTDGKAATASGNTTVTGVKVAGQPATIDDQGLHVGSTNAGNPVTGVANQVADQALKSAGMSVVVTQPSGKPDGAKVAFNAGSVVFSWHTPDSQFFTVALGGASVALDASPGFGSDLDAVLGADTGSAPTDFAGDTGTASPDAGGVSDVAAPADSGAPAAAPASRGAPVAVADASPIAHFKGLAPGLVVLVLGGSLLLAGTFRRLADDVLSQPASTCNLEE